MKALTGLAACAAIAAAAPAWAQTAEDLGQLRRLPERFSEAWAQHDAQALAAIMSPDVDFVNVGAIWLHGPAFETYHDRILKGRFRASTNTPLETRVRVIRPDLAIVRWSWTIRGETLADGRIRLRRTVEGFRFTTLPPNAAQTYRLRGRQGSVSLRFDYVVPNG